MYSLVGVDGNIFAVAGYTARCMKRSGLRDEVNHMYEEVTNSEDYFSALSICDKYIDECNKASGFKEV